MAMKNNDDTTQEVTFKYAIWFAPDNADEDMRQRDLAAEAARRHFSAMGQSFNVYSINRGRKNLIVRGSVS